MVCDGVAVIGGNEEWVDIDLVSGVLPQGNNSPRYRVEAARVFFDWGVNTSGFTAATAKVIGEMPQGLRPERTAYGLAVGNGHSVPGGRIYVEVNGEIIFQPSSPLPGYMLFPSGFSYRRSVS